MPKVRCQCGAIFQFDEADAGQKAKCKHCHAALILDILPTPDAAQLPSMVDVDDEDEIAGGTLDRLIDKVVKKRGHARRDRNLDHDLDELELPDTLVDERTPAHGYWQSLYWTLLFPTMPANLAMFVIFWLALVIGQSIAYGIPIGVGMRIIFVMPIFLVRCWYAGFQFSVLESATAGDRGLPNAYYSADIIQELFAPLFKWLGSWLVALLPAIMYVLYTKYYGNPLRIDWLLTFSGGPTGLFRGSTNEPLLLVLVCAGLMLWPMIVLTVALGGITQTRRIGHMLIVIFRSLPAYTLTLIIVSGCIAGNTGLVYLISTKINVGKATGVGNLVGSVLLQQTLAAGVKLYLDIVMLRAIGLYYHHFKHKFDFEWG